MVYKPMPTDTIFNLYTVSQKHKQHYFCYNYVKLPPNRTVFGLNCLCSDGVYRLVLNKFTYVLT